MSQGEQRKVSWWGKHNSFRDMWREPIMELLSTASA